MTTRIIRSQGSITRPAGARAVIAACVWMLCLPAHAEPDAPGCKDYFVSRMAGYALWQCDDKDFDSFTFAEGTDKAVTVEGRMVYNWYRQPDDAKPNSKLMVRRNYENALKAAGWTLVYADDDVLIEKQVKNGEERWVQLTANEGSSYDLRLAVKGTMQQTVTTADDMLAALNKDGHVALNINFDTGKAVIRPDSQPIVDQILALLQHNPQLKLSIEGHTDNAGSPASNKALSEARAKAVVAALTGRGVAASRLSAAGFGQDRPVADNGTEAGRAQNRRVELVKKG